MTYAQVKEDRALLSGYKHNDKVALSCTRCDKPCIKTRDYILWAIDRGQVGIFCTRACGRKYLFELKITFEAGLVKRLCKACYQDLPLNSFPNEGRSTLCGPCGRQTPRPKFQECKGFAKKRGYTFELTFNEFMGFWGLPCHYCGGDINKIGLDRVDNTIGYTLENVIPCCSLCNTMKHTDTYDNFIARCVATATCHPRG